MTDEQATAATRKHFMDSCLSCIEGAKTGKFWVNDLERYIKWQNELYEHIEQGLSDNTFTHQQYKHYLITGVCVPLLP